MTEDCISRDMALEKMADYVASGYADSAEDFEEYSKIICQLPSVQPKVKTGHWIDECICSCCGWKHENASGLPLITNYRYCPNCGCRMSEVSE